MRRALRVFAAGFGLLALPAAASAASEIKGMDTSGYPEIRFTVETPQPTTLAPSVLENGAPVAGLTAENLGRAKSVVLVVDRSVSMKGEPLADAVAAARAFVAAKPAEDRIAVLTVATSPVMLTSFATSTTDADAALRSITVDTAQGTKFYDAIVSSANALAAEPLPGRVVIAVTDGNETISSATLEEAVASAQDAGASVYVVAIESSKFTPEPLRELADSTGGTYYGAASSEALAGVYQSIAEELRRTWQMRYYTAARPGEKLELQAKAPGGAATAELTMPGTLAGPAATEPSPVLPAQFLQSWWGGLVLGLAVTMLVLIAGAFAFASPRGSWLQSRLAPHVGGKERERKERDDRERMAMAASLFRATERTFGHRDFWSRIQTKLDRADLPLRTVEFLYVVGGSSLAFGIVAALVGPPMPFVLGAFGLGALLPFGFVSFRAKRRLKAFDAQLPELLTTIAASLKAGHSFRQGIQAVVEEGQEPAAGEFKRVLAETRLGRPMDAALAEMSRRVGSKNLEFVLTAVTIQRQVGGSLAAIFDMVAETVRNRHQFARKVKGLTAMGRASAYVLVGLPFFVALAVTFVNAEYMAPLYYTSTGRMLIGIGLTMIAIGSLILRKMVSFRS
ncbi:MAG TPA: type II secretion system F family protein [Gaiellaceae bacterium]|nr:type II secretion system F family protein [Gaiellaceae bacterium]